MRKFISMEMVEATHAVMVDGNVYELTQSEIPKGEKIVHGYKYRFDDGVEGFCEDKAFEKICLLLDTNKELKTDKPSISAQMVDNFIARFYATTVGDKTTVVRAVLVNGFEIVESSSCVSPENYDEEIGKEICIVKIKDKVWELLGFLLATAVNGFNYETRYPSILHEEMKDTLDGEEEEALPFSDLPEQEDCGGDDCGCPPLSHVPCPPEQGCCPDLTECEKEESKPVSISIKETESSAFEIHMEGDNDKATAALEMAMSSLFISEYAHLDADMQLILADNMAARIGRGVRSMIMAGAKTEKE